MSKPGRPGKRDGVRWRTALLLCSSALAAAAAAAQSPGSTESSNHQLLRQQERERVLRQQQERGADVRLPAGDATHGAPLPSAEAPCFVVERIVLQGDAAERFQWALGAAHRGGDGKADPALGRCLGVDGINMVMQRVQNAIMKGGFVTARVLAHPQDLGGGTLTLTLIPGRVRAVRFTSESGQRATQWNAMPAGAGELLNLRDIEQALENFKRVPSAEADIQIAPAEGGDAEAGQSDLVIAWKQDMPFRLNVYADDSGSAATGKYQGGVTLSYDHCFTLNDLFYISVNHNIRGGSRVERGTHGALIHYSVPFGYWLLAFSASNGNYHQEVAGFSQRYQYRGTSRNSDVKLSRLVYRDAERKTTVSLRGWTRQSQNFIDDTEVGVQHRRMAGWELGLAHREYMAAASLDASLNYRRGTAAMGALPAPEEAFGEGTSRAALVTVDANLGVPFTLGAGRFRYTASWRMQLNRTPLIPQDRFAIGGRYTVRGYDGETSLTAERGWLLRNELGLALGASGQEVYVGLDHGEVGGPASAMLLDRRLTGAVVGLRGQFKRLQYELFVGRPVRPPERFRAAGSTAGFSTSMGF